jgi:hypothetical protein
MINELLPQPHYTIDPQVIPPNREIAAPNNAPLTSPIINMAKNDPTFANIFCCYDDETIISFSKSFSQFRIGDNNRSLLLAIAHYLTLHVAINRNMTATLARQSADGKTLATLDLKNLNMGNWNLTSFGLEYESLLKPAIAFAGMAFGI